MNESSIDEKTFLKLNNASSTGGNMQQPPMDDASFSQNQSMMGGDPNAMGGDPSMMGGDPNAMGGDQSMMGGDQNAMGGDPSMMGGDPNAMGSDPNMMGDSSEAGSDDTMSIINQLSDEDREAVRSYAESMLNNGGEQQEDGGAQPMMEQVIFTKKQLNKLQENFGPSQDELMKKNDRKELPKKNSKSKNSPFNSPFA